MKNQNDLIASNADSDRRGSVVESDRKGGLTFIEQLHAQAVKLCSNPSVPYMTGINYMSKEAFLLRGSCGLWSCPECGARNGRRWLARIINHMNANKQQNWYFVTLTAHEKWRGKIPSRENLKNGWKKLYNRIRRRYGLISYVKVWEYHKDGSWHLHLLWNRKIGKRYLKDNARACGMGYQVHSVQSKNAGQAAGYCAKYLIKSFENADQYVKGMRRIEVSRDWAELPELTDENLSWVVNQTRIGQDRTAAQLRHKGMRIINLRPTDDQLDEALRQ